MSINFKHYRINYQITSAELRLLDEEGKQIGVMSKIEALQKAKELNFDVVEMNSKANPPVAKLIDFKKFKYQEAKKEREAKKTQKNVGVKEIRLRPFIGQHDFDTRVAKANDWLAHGDQVKIVVFFKGREITRKEFGFEVLKKLMATLPSIKVVREPKIEGKTLTAMVIAEKKKE